MARPSVSILLAVRNEAQTIEKCLQALCQLQAPPDTYEILIGDDQSSDQTAELLLPFQEKHPYITVYPIQEAHKPLPGKAGVLALLAREARGCYFYFTDADVQVPPNWLDSAKLFDDDPMLGVLNGRTLICSQKAFEFWQSLEWIFEISCIKILANWGIPITAWGNNMAIRREAYEQTGGYETLGFSITEDFQLFRAVLQEGYSFKIVDTPEAWVLSEPCRNWASLISQRRRWIRAVPNLPFGLRILVYTRMLWFPLLLALSILWPYLGFSLALITILTQFILLSYSLSRLNRLKDVVYFFGYVLYSVILSIILLVYELIGRPISWKGRTYS